jgi:hypothetical protein
MNNHIKLLLLILIFTASAKAQDHAPSPSQCQADLHLWSTTGAEDADKLPFPVLQQRTQEMSDCMAVDKHPPKDADYLRVWGLYQLGQARRLGSYLNRHKEIGKFLKEDAAGVR